MPIIDASHIFNGKDIVLTGELQSFSREEAIVKITGLGGIIKTNVSSKTDYLVVSRQDKALVGEDGLSSKEEKVYAMIEKGHHIKNLKEDEFLNLLSV